jgi:Domain of unknown function (DUF1844)
MAEEKPSLHIDLDWKKQAQEEKRRLEEEEKRRADERAAASESAAVTPAGVVPGAAPMVGAPAAATAAGARAGARGRGGGGARELPPPGIPSLAQSLVTQVLFYLSDMGGRGGDEMSNMDMAKHLIDTLGVLEEKTQNNLTPEEQQFLDTALYEARMRFISVAGQVIAGA